MSTIPPVSPKSQPLSQRRPSSLRLDPPPPPLRVPGDAPFPPPSVGPDVTSTSPALRPLPPPILYHPSPSQMERHSSVVSLPKPSYSPPASPTSFAGSESLMGTASSVKAKENTGRWQAEEHETFLKGLNEHGKQWKKIAMMIGTRSVVQVRTHAQKYFQKLQKSEKKEDGRPGKERSPSILSTSTAASMPATAVKRKSSTKGNKTTVPAVKKRRVSLEPKPKKQPLPYAADSPVHHVNYQGSSPPQLMCSAPTMPSDPPSIDQHVIDPSFMNTLHMAEGELDDSLLDLLDDSSVEAVEQVIRDVSDDDLEPNLVEPTLVSPSASSISLAETESVIHQMDYMDDRDDIVNSPHPEDFTIHQTIGTSSISGAELSPTSVACMMDIKDFEQKTSSYVDALDWLMDVGVHQLPPTAAEAEEDWSNGHTALPAAPKLTSSKLALVNASALSVLDGDVF